MTKTVIESILGFEEVVQRIERFPNCPDCGHTEDEIVYSPQFECSQCGHAYSTATEYDERPVEYGVCSYCGTRKRFDRRGETEPLVFCLECGNLVAARLDGEFVDPLDVLEVDCTDGMCVSAETDEQMLASRILAGRAALDGPQFGFRDDLRYVLCCRDDRYYGYLAWYLQSDSGRPLLVQVWIDPRYRDMDVATSLLEHWCTEELTDCNGFEVVSPPEQGYDLLEAHEEDGTIFGKAYDVIELEDAESQAGRNADDERER